MTNPSTPTQQERCPKCKSDEPKTCRVGISSHPHGALGGCCPDPFHSSPNSSEPERCGGSGRIKTYYSTSHGQHYDPCPGCPDCDPTEPDDGLHDTRIADSRRSEPVPSEPIHGAGQEGERWTIYCCPKCGQPKFGSTCCGLLSSVPSTRVEVVPLQSLEALTRERDELRAMFKMMEAASPFIPAVEVERVAGELEARGQAEDHLRDKARDDSDSIGAVIHGATGGTFRESADLIRGLLR